VSGESATIQDLGSKNGTFLGESSTPIEGATPLADHARFRLGRVLLVFRSSPEAGSTLTERR
jgi:pSer/pThr/pTyr-binding forkhead associated (FHA) protein